MYNMYIYIHNMYIYIHNIYIYIYIYIYVYIYIWVNHYKKATRFERFDLTYFFFSNFLIIHI